MKRCELCDRVATNLVIFEATLAPGILPRLPYKWMCQEHCNDSWAEVLFKHGKPAGHRSLKRIDMQLFERMYADIRKRCVANNPELWDEKEKTGEVIPLICCPSKLTELEAEELRQAAVDQGRTIREGRAPVIEYVSMEDAAREIASRS